jgi:predicted ester cyclase
MNKRETVQALMDCIQKGDFENAKSMLAPDFQFSGPIPKAANAETWLGMSASLKAAFPDLDYHFKVIGAQGDVVRSTAQMSGTHNGSFNLASMKLGVFPATQRAFSASLQKNRVTVKENKITAWVAEPTDGAGLLDILDQLGVKPAAL